jgi:purine nucleosidase
VIPIIIDCDPGIDDTAALILATAAAPELKLVGVTTVFGNVPVERTTLNALKVLELCGAGHVPVAKGCARPILRPARNAQFIHGATGLGRVDLPEPKFSPVAQHGVDFLIETIRGAPAPITLVAVGPLTNVALAIVKEPEVMRRLERIVIMGGTLRGLGNMPNTSSFNVYADPHATEIVLRSGLPLVVCTIDATHMVRSTPRQLKLLREVGNRHAGIIADLFEEHAFEGTPEQLAADTPVGGCMHDPCCIAYLLAPDIFDGRMVNVQVDTSSELSLGRTVIDWWGHSDNAPNAFVINRADADAFFDLLRDKVALLSNFEDRCWPLHKRF